MKWLMHPLLVLIANATESELAKYVEYLKVENQILRERLPKKIETTEAERDKLLKVGRRLGPKIKSLISIVTPRKFLRGVQSAVVRARSSAMNGSAVCCGIIDGAA